MASLSGRVSGFSPRSLTPLEHVAKRILGTANGILHFALRLIRIAFRLELGIASRFADAFLDRPLSLVGYAFDPILVHNNSSMWPKINRRLRRRQRRPGVLLMWRHSFGSGV